MHAAAQGQSNIGIPTGVGKDFVAASHGQDVKALPQKVTVTTTIKPRAKKPGQYNLKKEGKMRK